MNEIMVFFEQYWGYTLFGGITLGTLITTAIALIKLILSNNVKNTQTSAVVTAADELISKVKEKDEQYERTLANMKSAQEAYFAELNRKQQEFNEKISTNEGKAQQVQAVTFTAISYIIMGSKLDDETKLSILNKMNKLLELHDSEVTIDSVKADIAQSVVNYGGTNTQEPAPVITTIATELAEAAQVSQTLFDKYTNNNEG